MITPFDYGWTAGDTVLWPNGTEGKVCGVDFDDGTLLDHCGGWHNMAEVGLVEMSEVDAFDNGAFGVGA